MNNTDLISRDVLLKLVRNSREDNPMRDATMNTVWHNVHSHIISIIEQTPAVDAEPVRHGRWIEVVTYDQDGDCLEVEYKCSECGRLELLDDEPYCNCGAKMDGKECVPRKCGTCSNDGWDMPQWRGTQEEV